MTRRTIQFISTASLAAVCAWPARADDESQYQRSAAQQQRNPVSQQRPSQDANAFQGRVASLRDASDLTQTLADADRCVKRITLQNGQSAVVDLGPNSSSQSLSINRGDHVQIRGTYRNVNGRQMLVAEDIRVNGAWQGVGPAQRTGQRNQDTARSGDGASDRQHQLSGKVVGTKQLTLRGSQGQQQMHTIARLELNDGKVIPVALGPEAKLEGLSIRKGQRLNVQAVPGTIDGRSILVAQRISAGDQSVQLRHGDYPTFRSTSGSIAQQTKTVRGEIAGFKHVNLRSSARDREQHSLVKIELENGRSQVVALGPKRDLDDFNLQVGKSIAITGQPGRIDGREVLFAQQIRVGNQTHRINWPARQQGGGTFAVRGTVQGYQVVTVSSGGKKQALLNLRLQDGRSILVDAGPNYTPGELKLDQITLNDEVIIRGQKKYVQGREVLIADDIQFREPERSRVRGSQGSAGDESQEESGGQSSDGKQRQSNEQQQREQQY